MRYGSIIYEYCKGTGLGLLNKGPVEYTATSTSRSGDCPECGRRLRGYRFGLAPKHKDLRSKAEQSR